LIDGRLTRQTEESVLISVRILGPLEVVVDGRLVEVPGDRTRAILARLAIDANNTVSVDRLLEDVWGETMPASLNALQVRISQLRLVVGRETVKAARPGYVIVMEPSNVDALVVEHAIADARRLVDQDPEEAATRLRDALALWRGPSFADIEAPFAVPAAARWEELRLGAIEDKLRLEVKAGRALQCLPELQGLAALNPFREPLHELLIRAYASLGRQAEALGAYRHVREQLVEELGIDPGQSLQELESGILRQDPSLLHVEPVQLHDSVPAPTGNLPRPMNVLLHRTADLDAVEQLMARQPIVTITGPAGVGKTRLALELAARSPHRAHGVWFVGLEATVRSDHVAASIAVAIGAHLDQPLESLRSRLRGADALLVLDNCEHLGEGPAAIVHDLVEHCPNLTVLATSQRPLGVRGEVVWPLEPLSRAESLDLFTIRVNEHNPRIVFDSANLASADAVCAALDDLPLAIELAARRCGVLGVDEVAERLGDRFKLLADRASGRPQRHQTLASAIAWSYELLFPDAQSLLQIIATFPDGVTLDALEGVAPNVGIAKDDVIDLVVQLVDRSLVVAGHGNTNNTNSSRGANVRHRVLNSIREFALARADEEQKIETLNAAYAAWVSKLAKDCAIGMRTKDQARWLNKFSEERNTIRVAYEWLLAHDPHVALELANFLYLGWLITGENLAAAGRLGRALSAAPDADVHLRVRVSACRAVILARAGHHDEAAPIVEWVLSNLERASPHAVAVTRSIVGQVYSLAGRIDEGLLLMGEARVGLAALGDFWAEAICVLNTALALGRVGDHDAQERLTNEALEILRPYNDPFVRRLALRNLALVQMQLGNYSAAFDSLHEGLAVEQSIGFADEEATTLRLIARIHRLLGNHDKSREALLTSIQASALRGDALSTDLALAKLIALHRSMNQVQVARSLLNQYRPKLALLGTENLPAALRIQIGALLIDEGNMQGALIVHGALAQALEQSDNHQQALALDVLASVESDDEQASVLRADADRHAELAGLHLTERPNRENSGDRIPH
jgi:predicted ATPase/DNA-binding SARP family transcriptional activator